MRCISRRVRFAAVAPACVVRCLGIWRLGIWCLGLAVVLGGAVSAQENKVGNKGEDEVARGHHLATLICSACHVAAPDQNFEPILRPPAPPFVSIAQRSNVTADFLRTFLATTHRDISSPNGMPNPQLLDYQIKEISAYILSLRKRS
jgi:mono/diheme cytochrome c family protein